ncbi:uncharacterized protein VTP21DRAFT_8757 [Calcarisporiella thermophila]|uniref:uncharacterized protein n=1 Tax=Calcarisporiella thermophila TaxID=911321 RepID=UPI003742A141
MIARRSTELDVKQGILPHSIGQQVYGHERLDDKEKWNQAENSQAQEYSYQTDVNKDTPSRDSVAQANDSQASSTASKRETSQDPVRQHSQHEPSNEEGPRHPLLGRDSDEPVENTPYAEALPHVQGDMDVLQLPSEADFDSMEREEREGLYRRIVERMEELREEFRLVERQMRQVRKQLRRRKWMAGHNPAAGEVVIGGTVTRAMKRKKKTR